MVNHPPTQLKHIYWRSRRGMLELELKLIPFVRDCFSDLTPELKVAYEQLLAEEDWQIFDWLQDRGAPEDTAVASVVAAIIDYQGRL